MSTSTRDPEAKAAHIEACLDPASQYKITAGFESYRFVHQALPGLSLDDISLALPFLGKELKAPLMIAPMTGGVGRGHEINRRLAAAAERHGLPMGLGSVRLALEDPERAELFKVRDIAPTALLFSNVGAGNLAQGWGPEKCLEAIRLVDADHLLIHLNPMQEALQPDGNRDFSQTLDNIKRVADALAPKGITTGVREVGFGLSAQAAQRLIDAGIRVLDCAGAGGTSWSKVEGLCSEDPMTQALAKQMGEWGIPTAESLAQVRALDKNIHLIATGGLRSGLDLAKAIALGADLGAMAMPFLRAADSSDEAVDKLIEETLSGLRLAMFGIGAKDIDELKGSAFLHKI